MNECICMRCDSHMRIDFRSMDLVGQFIGFSGEEGTFRDDLWVKREPPEMVMMMMVTTITRQTISRAQQHFDWTTGAAGPCACKRILDWPCSDTEK
mmetsp:Transcript_125322/g.241529  ORF Transcript_125322/g.241529 Transcript_125322/m.241529 type:complete len:96 (+) Transcript_125322:346-633(+)